MNINAIDKKTYEMLIKIDDILVAFRGDNSKNYVKIKKIIDLIDNISVTCNDC
jgi:hypothetical protein